MMVSTFENPAIDVNFSIQKLKLEMVWSKKKFFFFIFWLKRKQRAWRPHKTSSVFKKFDRTSKDLNANRVSCSLLDKELYQSFKSLCENCLRNNRERSYWLSSKKKSHFDLNWLTSISGGIILRFTIWV